MTAVMIRPPAFVQECEADGCAALSPEAPDDDLALEAVCEEAGWLCDAAGDWWCPAHHHLRFRTQCTCRHTGFEVRDDCTQACRLAADRASSACTLCGEPRGYGRARVITDRGDDVHLDCLRAKLFASGEPYAVVQGPEETHPRRKVLVDETGHTYGLLTVVGRAETASTSAAWRCRCACGGERIALGSNLRNGNVTSCGCKPTGRRKAVRP